jgi:putative endonuclease
MIGHNYYFYITTNPGKTTLYVGITNDIKRRLYEHAQNEGDPTTFTGKYFCYNLIYYELFSDVNAAIAREKQIKKWSREKKNNLIFKFNPEWKILNNDV